MERLVIEVLKEKSEETVNYYHENYVTFMTERTDIADGKVKITVTHFGKRDN